MSAINDIRKNFLDYFHKNGHAVIPSSSLVPENDPSLLFTNAGMVQFKNVFTGEQPRPAASAASAQKCVRAGGKHNDLENVGYTARHHTFFEMLGNFSFGDYFKEHAIELAWALITKDFGLPKEKLWVTIYHDDDDAANFWKKIAGLDEGRIIRITTDDNFWRMGDTGPCGPCSEIFYDHGDALAGGPPGSADEDGDRFVEIWNLVFMQYQQISAQKRIELPEASIDTGMGLERIAAILQGKHNNYDTDIFTNLIKAATEFLQADPSKHPASWKVIADHIRSIGFLIADGVLPSNEGRGYVLRRIMRRAMRHAHIIGSREPILHRLVSPLTDMMGGHYTQLHHAENLIRETLKNEEERFQDTLSRGLKLLEEAIAPLSAGNVLDGNVAFSLYDTYGFPVDLTADILRGRNLSLDMQGFDAAMQEQRMRARLAWSGSGAKKTDMLWHDLKEKTPATEFLGYQTGHAQGLIQHIIADNQKTDRLTNGQEGIVIVNQTVFYAQSGGQQGDCGTIVTADGEFWVKDTQKTLGLFLHSGTMKKGSLQIGESVSLQIDTPRRTQLMRHHSATHLLHQSLRKFLGTHVAQSGSLVAEHHLRFDFSHNYPISPEDLQKIEAQVNQEILANHPVSTTLKDKEAAIKSGALALFGEKYDDEVRVVSMGSVDATMKRIFSVELCGGTHVQQTAEIGMFKILSESSIAAGVRRIEAVCGQALINHFSQMTAIVKETGAILKTSTDTILERLAALHDRAKQMEKENQTLRRNLSLQNETDNYDKMIGDIAIVMRKLDCSAKDLKALSDQLHGKQNAHAIIVLGTIFDGRVSLIVRISESLSQKYHAAELVKLAAEKIDGQGGGKATLAQSGGKNCDGLDAALHTIMQAIEDKTRENNPAKTDP